MSHEKYTNSIRQKYEFDSVYVDTYTSSQIYKSDFVYTYEFDCVYTFEFDSVYTFEFDSVCTYEFDSLYTYEFDSVYTYEFDSVYTYEFWLCAHVSHSQDTCVTCLIMCDMTH